MKLSKQIRLGFALMLLLMMIIGGLFVFNVYKLNEAALNLQGRYSTLYKLFSNSDNEIQSEPGFGKEIVDRAVTLVDEQLKYNYTYMLIIVSVSIVFGGIITILFPSRITKPIERLISATKTVKKGDYSYRIENAGKADEICILAGSFNEMLQTIDDTHRSNLDLLYQTQKFNETLNEKVEEATESIREHQNELVRAYFGTLEAMILALDLRENETGYHSYRVTEYAVRLGKHANLSDEELSVMAKGALLHDIGKIGVPDSILLKPGKLTDDEWKLMKKHPELGYKLLKNIDFLEESAEIVHTHHERYDGQGYPAGMSRDEIPLGARIFSVVDALDAMTSKRSYRDALPFEEATRRITEASGSQFDPRVVDIFLEIPIDEWKNIRSRIADSGSDYLKQLVQKLNGYQAKNGAGNGSGNGHSMYA
ncbi:MAG TPA: HD domain-containing phosphohydrolase [Thermodesulfobacteriota bacterium]|nr:HD domain-containing phosphohydrolase [Thermodesulfobacteriota bacterium]